MLFTEILVFMLLGCGLGIITGLVPGIHINMVSALVVASLPALAGFSEISIATMIMAMSVTHTFLDFIPSVLFGAPEGDTALSVLPGHKMLLNGRALEAIKLTGLGSLVSLLITACVFIPVVALLPIAYDFIKPNILYLLIFVTCVSIGTEKKILSALGLFLFSGMFGFFLLNSSLFDSGIIFPALSGMFGISTMLLSLRGESVIPPQVRAKISIGGWSVLKNSFLGSIAGMIVGMLPGLGGAQATYLVQQLSKKGSTREFLVAASGVNTANIIFTLVVLYALGKMRSGIVIAIDQVVESFGFNELVIFLGVILCVGGIAMAL
ncbi:MAG: tripartite tricarboxylate transporter permease, partial [archaeon]